MRTHHGFTIVELMVTVMVMSLLTSIVVPVFGVARNRARSVTCQHHLRALSTAFQAYALDHHGLFPHEDDGQTRPPFGSGWHKVLLSYGDEQMLRCPAVHQEWREYSFKMNSLLETEARPFFRPWRAGHQELVLCFDGRAEKKSVASVVKGTWRLCDALRHPDGGHAVTVGGRIISQEDDDLLPGLKKPGPWRWEP